MQHAHVKRKENPMNRFSIDEYYQNPALRERLIDEARRERSRAIRAGLAWLLRHLAPRFDFGPRQWMERLG
jgi:hypothetical protein